MMAIAKQKTAEIQDILNRSYQLLQEGLVGEGFSYIVNGLSSATQNLAQEKIDNEVREECLQHPVAELVLQEPATRWSFQKPRGYSGDAILIDYMYRVKSCDVHDSYLGKELNGYFNLTPAVSSVRWRSNHIAQEIQKYQASKDSKISVLSVASGHLRELAYITDAAHKIDRFVCIDQDLESNKLVKSTYNQHHFLEVIDDSINYILKRKLIGQQFDFIYSAGLFDYLNDKVASRMIERLYEVLSPGGTMIIPNFLKDINEKVYMETFMKWNLIYRNDDDMIQLCSGLGINKDQIELYHDDMGNVVYLRVRK